MEVFSLCFIHCKKILDVLCMSYVVAQSALGGYSFLVGSIVLKPQNLTRDAAMPIQAATVQLFFSTARENSLLFPGGDTVEPICVHRIQLYPVCSNFNSTSTSMDDFIT